MRKKVLAAACGLMSLIGCASAQTVILKVAHFLPPVAPAQQKVIQPWCDAIEKESAGRLKCQIYPAMQLGGTPPQLVDQVKNGVADIVWTAPGYSAGRFPAIEAMELPFMIVNGESGNRAAWDYYQQHAVKEFAAFKVLAIHTDGGVAVHTGNKEVKGLADIKGLKLRAPNRMVSKTIEALGGTPVSMPPAQVTEAIAKGVVDGAMGAWEVVTPTKLDEVTRFHTEPAAGQPMFSATVLALLMNKQKFETLPAELKAIVDRHSGAPLVEAFGKTWDEVAAMTRRKVTQQGAKTDVLVPAEYDAMRRAAQVVQDEWIKDVAGKGLDGKQLAAAARELSARHGKK